MQKITTFLCFNGQAEEAMHFLYFHLQEFQGPQCPLATATPARGRRAA